MYAGVGVMIIAGILWVLAALAVHRLATVSATSLQCLPFQSGHRPAEHALSRYHVRWYLSTLVFLAFDIEMLFMYPWAVVVADLGAESVIEMFLFLGGLLVAVLWARREGVFRWV